MGEKDSTKNGGETKAAPVCGEKADAAVVGENIEVGPITVVLKLDLHCEGCAKKVTRSIRNLEGVDKVKADFDAKRLTVTGNVDPAWLRETVENKTKKKVDLISPQPKKGGAAAELNPGKKSEGNKKTKEVVINTVVMKIKLHCEGCAHKIKRIILKNIDGVTSTETEFGKDLVTVIGAMDSEDLVDYLREKLKREVEIVMSKKNEDVGGKKGEINSGDGVNKKEKESRSGDEDRGEEKEKDHGVSGGNESGGKKKGKECKKNEVESKVKGEGGEGSNVRDETTVELKRMEHHRHDLQTHYTVPDTYDQTYVNPNYGMYNYYHQHQHQDYSYSEYSGQYANGPPLPPPTYMSTNDGMFSDENPNGCFVM